MLVGGVRVRDAAHCSNTHQAASEETPYVDDTTVFHPSCPTASAAPVVSLLYKQGGIFEIISSRILAVPSEILINV